MDRIDAGSNAIAITAGGAITDGNSWIKADGNEEENLVGGAITLQAASGIGKPDGTADIDTAVTSIDARTGSGGIFIDETDDLALGRVDAGTGDIIVKAGGAIGDNTAVEGAGNENLVGGDISLTAASGIGVPGGAADIDTAAARIDAQTTSGGIFIDEADAVTLASTTGISAAAKGDIEITAGGEMIVAAGGVQAFASGDIRLTTTAGDLVVGGEVAMDSGDLELTASGAIRHAEGGLLRTRSDNQGTLAGPCAAWPSARRIPRS